VYVYQPLNAGGGQAVVRHMFHIISGQVVVWRGGRRVMVPACSEERMVEFPRFGAMKVWNMGHSEPETIPGTGTWSKGGEPVPQKSRGLAPGLSSYHWRLPERG
jgi:hypothetical protein